jgi:hypothetical protein
MIIDKLLSTFAFNFNLRRYSTVKDARRRLLAAIAVDYEIAVTDVAAAAVIQTRIEAVPSADLVTELKFAGLAGGLLRTSTPPTLNLLFLLLLLVSMSIHPEGES